MSTKKDPTLEELIDAARSEPVIEDPGPTNDVDRFVRDMKAKCSGPASKTVAQEIYWHYRMWCRDKKIKPRANRNFFFEFRRHFNIWKKRYEPWYYNVDSEEFELTDEERWEMYKFYRKKNEQSREKRKINKKKTSQESGS